jgi:Tfp pilus assembly protein PilN
MVIQLTAGLKGQVAEQQERILFLEYELKRQEQRYAIADDFNHGIYSV